MRYGLQTTTRFKKSYKKMQKRGLKTSDLEVVVDKLRNGVKLESRYRDHMLTGNRNGYRECHIRPDWLLIYKIYEDRLILVLVDTGTHADLLGM